MKPLIAPHSYHEPATLAAEREAIFLRHWIFAGTTQQLTNHEDFRRIEEPIKGAALTRRHLASLGYFAFMRKLIGSSRFFMPGW